MNEGVVLGESPMSRWAPIAIATLILLAVANVAAVPA